ncbi:MAG: hypothetical protein ABIJ45_10865, partial [Candidatus Zixiibacteriota bacterium]
MMKYIFFFVLSALLGISLLLSCGNNAGNLNIPVFNGERALSYIEEQVSFGPRVPGSEGIINCR